MDPLQILLRSRKNHQNFEIFDFDKKSRNHFKCNMGTFSLRKSLRNVDIGVSISEPRNIDFQVGVDLMDPLQILLRSRKNHQNFEISDFDKKSRNHLLNAPGLFIL